MRHFLFLLTLLVVSPLLSTGLGESAEGRDTSLILVMGATGSGKTSFINLASGSNLRVGHTLESCTNEVQVSSTFQLDGKWITLIDTPGFDDTTKSDTEILHIVAAFLTATYKHGKKLTGIIYLHRITDPRLTGVSSRNFKMFRELCGGETLKNVVIATNMWENLPSQDVGEAREYELRNRDMFFKPVLDKGAILLRNNRTAESAHNILRHLIDKNRVTLQIQRELVLERKPLSETAASAELDKQLKEEIERHKEEVAKIRNEMIAAIRNRDEQTRHELEGQAQRHQREIERIRTETQKENDTKFWDFVGHVITILPWLLA